MKMKRSSFAGFFAAKQLKELLERGERADGRDFLSYRKITIEPKIFKKAEGSAYVEIGDTCIAAGVKFDIGTPFPDTPNEGVIMTEGEILPIASFDVEPGPPSDEEIELSRVVDRGIRESKMIDLSKLVVAPKEKVIKVYLDFSVISNSGNLIDAANLAVVAALSTAVCPDIRELNESPSATIYDVSQVPLPIRDCPIAITTYDLGGNLLVDPTAEEELLMNARLTITHTKDDLICAMQKGEAGAITSDYIFKALEVAKDKSKELREILMKAVNK